MKSYIEYKNYLLNQASKLHIPIQGEFEITSRCNFRCPMCFVTHEESFPDKEVWKKIFLEAQREGMLFALLTGGEPLTSPDFCELYEFLFDLGVKITLYTNGSILTDKIKSLFEIKPPELIVITLYGGDLKTLKQFTKSDSFEQVSTHIDLYKAMKIPVRLRTIPSTLIYKNLDQIFEFVKSKNEKLGYSLYLSSGDYDSSIRLTQEQLLDFEKRMVEFNHRSDQQLSFYQCNALKNSFFMDSNFQMKPCSLAPYPKIKHKDGELRKEFEELTQKWNEIVMIPCSNCTAKSGCISCKAKYLIDGGCTNFLLNLAQERLI